ncbi:hypothetical protein GCM10010174_48560 [Kutzneria viridogrisea]|uniref:Subtilisin inhibitor domain-containing protein n=2 Tax=Kutzneria TaxID=43356 RepID=W5W8V2_9PSEU|nr:subtilase-type protease inhibitor [Kutzneria albida]AHH96986.1 hypothetical protein KALB_3622 [Kutzneria albida DSM 43870]MBA8932049.1 hypothetical protein [Kutzneria viridogrisea]
MVRSGVIHFLAVYAAFATLVAGAGTARGLTGGMAHVHGVDLRLTVTVGAGSTAKSEGRDLFCEPVGGDHPNRALACRDLEAAAGALDNLPGRTGTCAAGLEVYLPITVQADGYWKGSPVAYSKVYPNRCRLLLATGPVFEF